jgi:zinc transporter ZupT
MPALAVVPVPPVAAPPALDPVLLARWASVLALSQLAFLVTGFFLSRPYATVFFLTFGMAGGFIMFQMNQDPASNARWNWVKRSILILVAGTAFIYVLARGH